MEAASPAGPLEELRAALARSEQGRRVAEACAAALQAGQAQAARELASLQSLFRQAVEENRGLLEQLAACRARVVALEAAAAVQPPAAPPPLPPEQPSQPYQDQRYPPIYGPDSQQAADAGSAAQPHRALPPPHDAADQLSRAKRALAELLHQPPPPPSPLERLPPSHTAISLPADAALTDAPAELRPTAEPAAPPSSAAPQPAGDLQRVFSELQALQRRLQAAEDRLQLQAAGGPPAGHAAPQPCPRPCIRGGGGTRPASPSIPARLSDAAARQKQHEHRDSYQLIRELKQRRARLEVERLAATAAALAGGTLPLGAGACSPPPVGPPASGARAAPWLFDTRDLSPAAALHQPLPRRALASKPAGATGQVGLGGSSEASPMAWHAASQRLPRTAGGSSRGRRSSISAEPHRSASRDRRQPLQQSNRRRSTSRSRSEREEVDRLLMAGRPTTQLASGGKGAAGSSASRSGGRQRGTGQGGAWVTPLVLA